MSEPVYREDRDLSPAQRLGQTIYHLALGDRRGFRPGQIGIDEDDPVWLEIFDDIGKRALEATKPET